jgi:hypothetical protein
MRVTKILSGFNPIEILLETKNEASLIWHLLHCPKNISLRKYADAYGIELFDDENTISRMFNSLDKVFHP